MSVPYLDFEIWDFPKALSARPKFSLQAGTSGENPR